MFTIETLHVIAATVFLNANVTLRAVFGVGTNVIGRFTVVRTFGQPTFDDLTIGGGMIVGAAFKTKCRMAFGANDFFRGKIFALNNDRTIGTRTES